jgi:hypothetical protein
LRPEAGQSERRSGALWAITSYFNPMGYRRRRANFRLFRERLGLPLVAVELAYGPGFELGESDAEILVRLRGSDVLWQKERLLNVALASLPPSCTKVAWIDCDVFFEDPNWHLAIERLLDEVPIAQAFSRVAYLSRGWTPSSGEDGIAFVRPSRVAAIPTFASAVDCFNLTDRSRTGAPGFAWAARRDILERHGFYDASIIGGGDRLLACAAYDYLPGAATILHDEAPRRRHYERWARPFADEIAGRVGFVDGMVRSLWHGDIADRRLDERFRGLRGFGFDPEVDIAVDEGGAWRWNSDKPALHAYVRDYFAARREDG